MKNRMELCQWHHQLEWLGRNKAMLFFAVTGILQAAALGEYLRPTSPAASCAFYGLCVSGLVVLGLKMLEMERWAKTHGPGARRIEERGAL